MEHWKGKLLFPTSVAHTIGLMSQSMGFIYSRAVSVIVVLQRAVWEIVGKASASNTAMQLSPKEMEDLEQDTWISRVWTYQEIVNTNQVYFTTFEPLEQQVFVPCAPLLDCVGYSSERWTKETETTTAEFLLKFPNLNNLADTLVDATLSGYLERSALGVLTNMAARRFDPKYPGNRLLASLGALTQKPSWSPAATMSELAEKVMSTCEEVNDYSFIYTSDKRDERSGLGWRPSPHQPESNTHNPVHLVPVLNWPSYGEPMGSTQRAHRDSKGLWLDSIIRLQPSESMRAKVEEGLDMWLYGQKKDLGRPGKSSSIGFFGTKERGKSDLMSALFNAFQIIGFTGSSKCQICENGLFFSVLSLKGRQDLELFVAGSIRWKFGAPGLALWKEGTETKYSAGVFAGDLGQMIGQPMVGEPLLMI